MSRSRVFVVGSLNLDLILPVRAIPRPGETVLAGSPQRSCGGKGANQAVAAARSGADVAMVGCIGTDEPGEVLLENLTAERIDTTGIARVDESSGLAVVAVDRSGENTILVAPGANLACGPEVVQRGLATLHSDDIVVAQGEIPVSAIVAAAGDAAAAGATFVLNLAPVVDLDLAAMRIGVLIVNEHEAAQLRGRQEGPEDAARDLAADLGCSIVITMGGAGVMLAHEGELIAVPAYRPEAIRDTTGAGDAFVGGFVAALACAESLDGAVRWGAASGSIAVATIGAQSGGITRQRILEVIGRPDAGTIAPAR